ncbi:MAG: hypothetical protein ACRC92_20205 [Peptostreptococcaceae bacterium]
MKFLFLSDKEITGSIKPRKPGKNNHYCRIGIEDKDTPRISVAKSIDDCLTALADKVKPGSIFNVYEINVDSEHVVDNSVLIKKKLVPFAKHIGENWVITPVTPKYLYSVKVLGIVSSNVKRMKSPINKETIYRVIDKYRYTIIGGKK